MTSISEWMAAIAANNQAKGFWSDGDRPAELAMLVVTEVAEYVEALRDRQGPGDWHFTDKGKLVRCDANNSCPCP